MALAQRIESLKKRHADLDHKLHEERVRPASDDGAVCELKRLKLRMKDEIVRLAASEAA